MSDRGPLGPRWHHGTRDLVMNKPFKTSFALWVFSRSCLARLVAHVRPWHLLRGDNLTLQTDQEDELKGT